MSPTLYNVFLMDLKRHHKTSLCIYADDTCLISASKHSGFLTKQLQHHIDILENYCTQWKIKLNGNKTQAIHFSRQYTDPPRVFVEDNPINWSKTAKYLGLTLDRRLTFGPHVTQTINKMKIATAALRCLIFNPKINIYTRTLIYNACVKSIAIYAGPVFFQMAKTNVKRLETQYSSTLRKIRAAWRYLKNSVVFRDLGCEPLKTTVQRQLEKLFTNSLNMIIESPGIGNGRELL